MPGLVLSPKLMLMASEKGPDGLPIVSDEAGETPKWVPILGGVLLCIGILYATLSAADQDGAEVEDPVGETAIE